MELMSDFVNNQFTLYIPVALVLVAAVLVFAFGFKSAEQPPFDKLSSSINDDRKSGGKKRKLKEKKPVANGHIINVGDNKSDKSPSKDIKRPAKEPSDLSKDKNHNKPIDKKKNEIKPKKSENLEEVKNKKNTKLKTNSEKPVDFDDGNWETVPTKGDKKKKQDSPAKKEKKTKKADKPAETDKLAKEVVVKNSPEKETKESVTVPIKKEDTPVEVEVVAVESKKEKKIEKKTKKENVDKQEPAPLSTTDTTDDSNIEVAPSKKQRKAQEGGIVFDELGDIWTEAKAAKKSKKKTRRDN